MNEWRNGVEYIRALTSDNKFGIKSNWILLEVHIPTQSLLTILLHAHVTFKVNPSPTPTPTPKLNLTFPDRIKQLWE